MKKVISFLTAGVLISLGSIISIYASELPDGVWENASKADFNADGNVTQDDAQIVLNYIAKSKASGEIDDELEKRYDVNGDGRVNPLDASYILYYIEQNEPKEDFLYEGEMWQIIPSNEASITDDIRENASRADFDLDGKITSNDADLLLQYCAKLFSNDIELAKFKELGDISGNGTVNTLDVSYLAMYIIENNLPGDINEDGKVTPADASYILKYIADYSDTQCKDRVKEFRCTEFGDINGDGKLTAIDASLILAYTAELASDENLTLEAFLASRNK